MLIPKHHELSRRIDELTEDLEELRSKKAVLLQSLQYAEDTSADMIRKDIATMEVGLKRLEEQEQKYIAEIDNAFKVHAELKEQMAEFDADKLMSERLVICPGKERAAVSRVQSAYGDRYQPLMMYDSKRDVAKLLHENATVRSVREQLRKPVPKQIEQEQLYRKPKIKDYER